MDERKICSFFGHRELEISDALREGVTAEIMRAIDFGCRVFYFGGYGKFDAFCYEAVSKIKRARPDLALHRVYCVSMEKYLRKRVRYFNPEDFEEVIYLEPAFTGWYSRREPNS